jgi:PKD repeat protein
MKKTFLLGLIFLFAVAVAAVIVERSPTVCSGEWTSCSNAFADDSNRATAAVTGTTNKSGIWRDYNISIPSDAAIDQVRVRIDFFASKTNGYVGVRVSPDGGATWSPQYSSGGVTKENTVFFDFTNDISWTAEKLNNTNFRVNATCFKVGSGANPTCNLDWIPVNVSYTPDGQFDFSVSTSPGSASVSQGKNATSTTTVTLLNGTSEQINLSSAGCPPSSTCTFNPASGNPTYNSTFTVATGVSTPTGTYVINISGKTSDGIAKNTTFTVNVTDSQPVANASANKHTGDTPLNVGFTGSVSSGDSPFTYFWDFNDGTNSTFQNPSHNFNNAGTYNVTFRVTDFDGDSSTTAPFVIIANNCTRKPIAITIAPAIQAGPNGTTLNYTTTVNNTDSGEQCGSAIFNLSASIPVGWSSSFANNQLNITAGSTGSTTFSLTSAANGTGVYTFNNTAVTTDGGYRAPSNSSQYNVTS